MFPIYAFNLDKCGLYTIKRRKAAANDQNLFLKFVWLDKNGNENHMDSNPNRLSFNPKRLSFAAM